MLIRMGFQKIFFPDTEIGNPVGFPILQKGKCTPDSSISVILSSYEAQG